MNRELEPFEFYAAVKVLVMDALAFYDSSKGTAMRHQGQHPKEARLIRLGARRRIGFTYTATRLWNDFPGSFIVARSQTEAARINFSTLHSTVRGKNSYRAVDPASLLTVDDLLQKLRGNTFRTLAIIDGGDELEMRNLRQYVLTHTYNHCKVVVEFP